MLGRIEESLAAGEQAYRAYLDAERQGGAAMAAIHVGVQLLLRGDDVLGIGWLRRAERVLQDVPPGPPPGFLRYLLEVEAALGGPDLDAVIAASRDVGELGAAHDNPNLVVLGLSGEGRALVKQSRTDTGLALLDETMVAVLTEDLRPEWAGNVCCHLMAARHELGDIRRAVAFTDATPAGSRPSPTPCCPRASAASTARRCSRLRRLAAGRTRGGPTARSRPPARSRAAPVRPGASCGSRRRAQAVDEVYDGPIFCAIEAHDYWHELHPHTMGGAYVNFMMEEGEAVRSRLPARPPVTPTSPTG